MAYISPSELSSRMSQPCRALIHFNARSIRKNYDNITSLLSAIGHQFSIICISETWLCEYDRDLFKFPSYSSEYCHRIDDAHGGAAIFISSCLHYHRRLDLALSIPGCESVWIELHEPHFSQDSKNLVVACIYRSPSSSVMEFCLALGEALKTLSLEGKRVIILGDMNINLLDDTKANVSEYISCFSGYGYECLITAPTRVPLHGNGTIIDHILSNLISPPEAAVIEVPVTDHYPIYASIGISNNNKISRCFKNILNTASFINIIEQCDWSAVKKCNNAEIAYQQFSSIISNAVTAASTLVVSRKKYLVPINPWLTPNLLKCLRKKDNLYKKTKKCPFNVHLQKRYKEYSNTLGKLLKAAKLMYFEDKIKRAGNDVKQQWKTVNNFLGRTTVHSDITLIHSEKRVIDNPSDIANSFNDSFGIDIPQSTASLEHTCSRLPHSFFLYPTSPEEVFTVINSIRNTSAGLDKFFAADMKLIAHLICDALCHIINLVFGTGFFPTSLKKAKIIPVFKKGDKRLISNYRPIAIISFFSKVIEKLFAGRLRCYLDKFHILSNKQFGFRPGYSTELAMISLTEEIKYAIDSGSVVGGVFLDLSKAFDSISHDILFQKLQSIGVSGVPLELIRNYLRDREQVVYVSGTFSNPKTINIGVPQGSILGPLLFLIYINDLPQCLAHSSCILYADDTTILTTDKDVDSMLFKLNTDLINIVKWFNKNKLNINAKKSNFVVFSSPNRIIPRNPSVFVSDTQIHSTSSTMFLGVKLDEHLKFNSHVLELTRKAAYAIRIFLKVRPFFRFEILLSLYYAFFHSNIIYCISSWGNTYATHLSAIQHLQNQALRIITFSGFMSNASSLLCSHGILSVQKLAKYFLGILIYKYVNGKLPIPLLHSSQFPQSSSTRFAKANNFLLPKPRTNYGKFTTKFSSISLWNSLPLEIKNRSLEMFKKGLRSHLLNS